MVGKIAALDGLDPDQRVGANTLAGHGSRGEIDSDAARRVGVDRAIDAVQADDGIVAAEPLQDVVAGGAGQRLSLLSPAMLPGLATAMVTGRSAS